MNRETLAAECVRIERCGGSVREYLRNRGCISPWGTWFRLQLEQLGRDRRQITDGKGGPDVRKITLEQKKKAVEIALGGGNPLPYLKECGSKKPEALWYTIKQNLKVTDPEAFAKLPERVGARQNVAEPDCTLVICDGETVLPLESEITDDEPSHFFSEDALQDAKDEDDLEITAVRNKVLGRFQFDEEHEVMIWNSPYGDEVMMDAEHWWKMADLLPKVLQKLKIDKNGDENPKI